MDCHVGNPNPHQKASMDYNIRLGGQEKPRAEICLTLHSHNKHNPLVVSTKKHFIAFIHVNKARVTPSDIQHSAATQVIENQVKSYREPAVMSSASSAVTYTSVYTDSEPGRVFWGADEEISDGGSPRVIVLGYDGLPMQPVAPPSSDYILGPEEPQTPPVPQDEDEREPMFIQPHEPDYVAEPIYPEYIPLKDEHEFPVKKQPSPVDSPTAESPRYVVESDPEEDPEEYEDDETEDGPVDYPWTGEMMEMMMMAIHLGMTLMMRRRRRRSFPT
ncbi:hypothetical protein Tco_0347785 [Tanacetum coccineum]